MNIDWSKPLEAIHEDGRIGKVEPHAMPERGRMCYAGIAGVGYMDAYKDGWDSDGKPLSQHNPWRIRNATQPQDPAIYDRMVALVKRMATEYADSNPGPLSPTPLPNGICYTSRHNYEEARAIVTLLEPVDGDEADFWHEPLGIDDTDEARKAVSAAIKFMRGRAGDGRVNHD